MIPKNKVKLPVKLSQYKPQAKNLQEKSLANKLTESIPRNNVFVYKSGFSGDGC